MMERQNQHEVNTTDGTKGGLYQPRLADQEDQAKHHGEMAHASQGRNGSDEVSRGMAEEKRKAPFNIQGHAIQNEGCQQMSLPPPSKLRVLAPGPTGIRVSKGIAGGSTAMTSSVNQHTRDGKVKADRGKQQSKVHRGNKQYDQMSDYEKQRMEENRRKALKNREKKMEEEGGKKSTANDRKDASSTMRKDPAMTILRDVAVETGDERLMDVAPALGTIVRENNSDSRSNENDSNERDANHTMPREDNECNDDRKSGKRLNMFETLKGRLHLTKCFR